MPAAVHVSYPADGVGLIVMDNPPRNFGSFELLQKVEAALEEVKRAGCTVAVLASDIPGYFMAHAYLTDLVGSLGGGPTSGDPRVWRRLTNELEQGPLVTIAANNGQAWGGGSELSWACNLRIAARSATYGQPEVLLGIIPGAGGCVRLPRLVGLSKAMELVLTGEPITAEQALQYGLVHRVVPDDRLREEAIAWAARIAALPRWAVQAAKRALVQGMDLPLEHAIRLEGYIFNSTVRPAVLEIMRQVQERYEAGADSYEALGLPRP